MRKIILYFFLSGLLFTVACKKETTKWDTDWSAPIAYGHLTINDMIPVKYTETNSDGYLSLVIHESVFAFSLDTLLDLPDATVQRKTAIGIASLNIAPDFETVDNYDQEYAIGEVQLKRMIIQSGTATARMESVWPGKTELKVTFNNVTGPDGPFEHTYFLDAGSIASPAVATGDIDMAFQDMDLTGIDGTGINTIGIDVVVSSNEETDTYTITNIDTNTIAFTFKDLIPRYAKGYFGQHRFTDTTSIRLAPMNRIVAGSIDLDSIDLKLTVKNGFNIVGRSKISMISGYNNRNMESVELDFAEKGNLLNIDPAFGGLYDYVPSERPIELNNTNSNILDFIENLSDSIEIGYLLEINPFGNTSAGSDEFFPDSKMELFVDGEFPLNFSANDLTITDTINISWVDSKSVRPENGIIALDYSNGFPIGAITQFYLMDGNSNIIDSITGTTSIQPGINLPESIETTATSGTIQFNLSDSQMDNLENAKKMSLRVAFTSYGSEKVKISPEAFFDFKIRTNLQIRVTF